MLLSLASYLAYKAIGWFFRVSFWLRPGPRMLSGLEIWLLRLDKGLAPHPPWRKSAYKEIKDPNGLVRVQKTKDVDK